MKTIKQNENKNLKDFEKIAVNFRPKIMRLVKNFGFNNELCEDLTQEIFLKVVEKISLFKGQSKLESWIYSIAINHCINFKKKYNRVKLDYLLSLDTISKNETPEKDYLKKELGSVLKEHIAALPEKIKAVFHLYNFKGLSQKEIAMQLNIPTGTVWSRMNSAKKILRDKLAAYYPA